MGRVPALGTVTDVLPILHGQDDVPLLVNYREVETRGPEQPLQDVDAGHECARLDPADSGRGDARTLGQLALAQVADPASPAIGYRPMFVSAMPGRCRRVVRGLNPARPACG